MVLGKFGVNVGAEQMRDYIRRFDRNGDGLISPEEFRIIVEERIISEMLDVEDFVEELRIEYTKQGSKYINLQQLHQLCKNLGAVNITPEESAALFSEVD
jgi:Ca2+-binding EF-hand superfamily protein